LCFFEKSSLFPLEWLFLSFFRGICTPLRKGMGIPMRIGIPRNRLIPNIRMIIPME
jgi:hypothetical protein